MSDLQAVLVVDISHAFWTTAMGMRAALGATDVVMRDIRRLERHYDRIAIVCDPKGPSWRAAICDGYKQGRMQRTPEQWAALDRLIEYCGQAGWHVFKMPEHPDHPGYFYEADDGIATIVEWLVKNTDAGTDVLSGDSDLAMLTDDVSHVRFVRRYNGEMKPMCAEDVESWTGIPPARILEVKAIAGDGDGYKPFPGIAKAGAVKLLKAAPEMTAMSVVTWALEDGIPRNQDGSESKVSKTLKEGGVSRVDFGYQMARLCNDVPFNVSVILEKREAVAASEVATDLLPDDAPEVDAEIVDTPRREATNTALATVTLTYDGHALMSPEDAREQMKAMQRFIRACMKPGTDYNQYQGMPKPFLHKPGAEKLADLYGFTPDYECLEKIEKWDGADPFFFYRYKCILKRRSDGSYVGSKVGSCNSREAKYAGNWRWERDVPGHLELDRLKIREWQKNGKTIRKYYVPNEDVCSLVHTIDTMAQKRAYVLAVREATRTGGIFDVDEDLPRGGYEGGQE